MKPIPASGTRSAVQVQETFAELVCADPDLVRAEFDAIIEANWGGAEPPALAGSSDIVREPPSHDRVGPEAHGIEHASTRPRRTYGLARLRSPPDQCPTRNLDTTTTDDEGGAPDKEPGPGRCRSDRGLATWPWHTPCIQSPTSAQVSDPEGTERCLSSTRFRRRAPDKCVDQARSSHSRVEGLVGPPGAEMRHLPRLVTQQRLASHQGAWV